jgi:hypothetical protein
MSLETWLLVTVVILLLALLGISLFALFAFPRWLFLRQTRYFPELYEEWRGRSFPTAEIDRIISIHEEQFGLRLTPYARQMLTIPVEEQVRDRQFVDVSVLNRSITIIFEALREDRSEASRSPAERLNSVGVIRAFHKRFCNIPPFCASTEQES